MDWFHFQVSTVLREPFVLVAHITISYKNISEFILDMIFKCTISAFLSGA